MLGYLDEVERAFLGKPQGFLDRYDSDLFPLLINDSDLGAPYLIVYENSLLQRGSNLWRWGG